MAYIIKVEAEEYEEVVVIWSNLLAEEIAHLTNINPEIQSIKILERYPSKHECLDIDKERKHVKYNLPKIYTETRRRREENE